MPTFSKAELTPKSQNLAPPLRWIPSDPEGRRWELWGKSPSGARCYLGRVLVLHREKVSVGHFTAVARRALTGRPPVPTRWTERHMQSLPAAARHLLASTNKQRAQKSKAPSSKR